MEHSGEHANRTVVELETCVWNSVCTDFYAFDLEKFDTEYKWAHVTFEKVFLRSSKGTQVRIRLFLISVRN